MSSSLPLVCGPPPLPPPPPAPLPLPVAAGRRHSSTAVRCWPPVRRVARGLEVALRPLAAPDRRRLRRRLRRTVAGLAFAFTFGAAAAHRAPWRRVPVLSSASCRNRRANRRGSFRRPDAVLRMSARHRRDLPATRCPTRRRLRISTRAAGLAVAARSARTAVTGFTRQTRTWRMRRVAGHPRNRRACRSGMPGMPPLPPGIPAAAAGHSAWRCRQACRRWHATRHRRRACHRRHRPTGWACRRRARHAAAAAGRRAARKRPPPRQRGKSGLECACEPPARISGYRRVLRRFPRKSCAAGSTCDCMPSPARAQ